MIIKDKRKKQSSRGMYMRTFRISSQIGSISEQFGYKQVRRNPKNKTEELS